MPLNHPFYKSYMFDRILQYKPSSYWRKPRCMEALIYMFTISKFRVILESMWKFSLAV